MLFLRKIIFYIFAVIYIIFCPLLILYSFGYILQPGTEKGVIGTGVIYLSTAPAGATIYVDGKQHRYKTPTVLRELVPGDYSIKMTLGSYDSWEDVVPVEIEKATVLDKVLLLPEQWDKERLVPGQFRNMITMPDCDYVLLVKGPALSDIYAYNYTNDTMYPLAAPGSVLGREKVVDHFKVSGSPVIIFKSVSSAGRKLIWAALQDKKSDLKDITEFFKTVPAQIQWQPGQETDLFAFQKDYINRIDLEDKAVYPEYVRKVRGYGLFDGKIYVLKRDNRVLRMNYDKQGKAALLDDPKLGRSIFKGSRFFDIKVLSADFILFTGEKGQLLCNRLPYVVAETGVRGTSAYLPLNKTLFWTKDKIGVLDFTTEETGDVEFEIGPTLTWVYTKGRNIKQAFWVYDGSHVLFRDADNIFLLEMEEYGRVKIARLCSVQKNSAIYYSEGTGKLYFIGSEGEGLYAAGILPSQGVITSPFPELGKTTKKGNT